MTIDRNYYRVYTKSTWDGDSGTWNLRTDLIPVTATRTAAPGTGTAVLVRVFGSGYDDQYQTALPEGDDMDSLAGLFVRITRCDDANGTGEEILFVGVFPSEEFEVLGQSSDNVKTANQTVHAVELDWFLNKRIDWALVVDEESYGDSECKILQWTPGFNRRTRTGGVRGNRSDDSYRTDATGAWVGSPAGIDSYVFENVDYAPGSPWGVWTVATVLDYLRRFFPADLEITYDVTAAVWGCLFDMVGVWDPAGKTVKQMLNELLSPGRGFGWALVVDDTDAVTIKLYSLLDSALAVGSLTIPAHDAGDKESPSLWTDDEKSSIQITADSSRKPDVIRVRGGLIKACGTFSLGDDTLEAGWTSADETAYEAAASNSMAEYDGLTETEKGFVNDRFRDTDRMGKVFSAFSVPKDWDWICLHGAQDWDAETNFYTGDFCFYGGNIYKSNTGSQSSPNVGNTPPSAQWNAVNTDSFVMNPQWDPDVLGGGGDFTSPMVQAEWWNAGKRFLPFLPFLEGYDYDGSSPVNNNLTTTEPDWRRMFAVVKKDGEWIYADTMRPYAATVRPMADQPGALVRTNPAHIMGLNHIEFSAGNAEPTMLTDDLEDVGVDYSTLRVTAMIETDQIFALHYDLGTTLGKEITIDVPDAELWYCCTGTVFEIGPAGNLKRFACTSNKLRDDSDVLEAVLAAATAWYGRTRYKAVLVHEKIDPITELGTMLSGLDVEGGGTAGACVSSIHYDFRTNRTRISTQYAELNLTGLASAADIRGKRVLSSDRTEYTTLRRRVENIERELAAPPRTGSASGGGGGGSSSQVWGIVIRGLMEADAGRDPEDGPEEGYGDYIVRLESSAAAYQEWEEEQDYVEGDQRTWDQDGETEDLLYTARVPHTSSESNAPGNEAFWTVEPELAPKPITEPTAADLRHFHQGFAEGDVVPLVLKDDVWLFNLAMVRVYEDGERSLWYDHVNHRLTAVYG